MISYLSDKGLPDYSRLSRLKECLLNVFFERLACPVCGCEGAGLCMACKSDLRPWGSFYLDELPGHAMYHYQGTAKRLIYGYKQMLSWEAERGLYEIIDKWLDDPASDLILRAPWDLIVPVASVRARVLSRGFDPAHRLARYFSGKTNIKLLECIENKGNSEHKNMGFGQRRLAAESSFAMKPAHQARCKGKKILIFDDILTTGTTIQAVATHLKAAGAQSIGFLVVERASL